MGKRETPIQNTIIQYLNYHPKVAWVHRMNTGAAKYSGKQKDYFVRFAFRGCSDIIGQTICGKFLAVEVKVPGNTATEEQQNFLDKVNKNNGLACVAWSVNEVESLLSEIP